MLRIDFEFLSVVNTYLNIFCKSSVDLFTCSKDDKEIFQFFASCLLFVGANSTQCHTHGLIKGFGGPTTQTIIINCDYKTFYLSLGGAILDTNKEYLFFTSHTT